MLLTATFPICDLRALLPSSGQAHAAGALSDPAASAAIAWVPRFGAIRSAGPRARARGSPGNPMICAAERAIRVVEWPFGKSPGPFRVVLRDLCGEGDVLRRLDFALATRLAAGRSARRPTWSVGYVVQRFLTMKVDVRAAHRPSPMELRHARFAAARGYAEATTLPGQGFQLAPDAVVAADPVFFVVWSEEEGLSDAGAPPLEPLEGHPGVLVGRAPRTDAGPTSCVWYLKATASSMGRASELRAAIADLCAQRACLGVALGQIEDGRLSPPPDLPPRPQAPVVTTVFGPVEETPAAPNEAPAKKRRRAVRDVSTLSGKLQDYLDRTISILERRGRNVPVRTAPLLFDAPAGESRRTPRPALERLDAALDDLGVRPTLTRRVLTHLDAEARSAQVAPPPEPVGAARHESLPRHRPLSRDHFVSSGRSELPAFEATLQARLGPRGKERVSPDERVTFEVQLRYDQAFSAAGGFESTKSIPFEIAPDQETRRLLVFVDWGHFEPRSPGASPQTVILRRDGPGPSTLELEAIARGDRPWYTLSATLVLDGQPVGTLAVTLGRRDSDIQPPEGSTSLTASLGSASPAVIEPAVQVHIARVANGLDVTWVRRDGEAGGPWSIDFDTSLHWNALSGKQYQSRSALGDYSLGLGTEMNQDLLGAILASDDGGTVLVVSPSPVFPFELVAPGDDQPFLGATRAFARWTSRPDIRPLADPQIVVKKAVCIRPEYGKNPLKSAADEEVALGEQIEGLEVVRDEAGFKALLQQAGVSLVHFAGHAEDNPPVLKLGDQEKAVPARFLGTPLAKGRPFVFVNGCRAAMAQPGIPPSRGNMIDVLLASNLGGVVAPFITVDSKSAFAAAERFYASALGGKTVAEAVRDVHALADSDPANAATYMSYLAYAPPSLRLVLDPPKG